MQRKNKSRSQCRYKTCMYLCKLVHIFTLSKPSSSTMKEEMTWTLEVLFKLMCSYWHSAFYFRKFTGKYLYTLFDQWKRIFHVENLVCNICITFLTLRGHSMPSCRTEQPSLFNNSVIKGCPACKPVIYNCMQECDLAHSILLLLVFGQCSHLP